MSSKTEMDIDQLVEELAKRVVERYRE